MVVSPLGDLILCEFILVTIVKLSVGGHIKTSHNNCVKNVTVKQIFRKHLKTVTNVVLNKYSSSISSSTIMFYA